MKFELPDIKRLVEKYGTGDPDRCKTHDAWLDDRYDEQATVSGLHRGKYYRLFHNIARLYEPRFVVELGSAWATAAAHFAAGCPTADVVTIDAHKEIHPTDDVAWRKALEADSHYDNLRFVHGWTWDEHVVVLVAELCPIDILFIDAGHRYESVTREWSLYSPLLADEALVVCDDIHDAISATVDMVKFWDELDYEKFLDKHIHLGVPMGFLKYRRV